MTILAGIILTVLVFGIVMGMLPAIYGLLNILFAAGVTCIISGTALAVFFMIKKDRGNQ